MPLFNMAHYSAYYPFYFLWAPLFDGPFHAAAASFYIRIGHLWLAGFNMYIASRVLRIPFLGALSAAAFYVAAENTTHLLTWLNFVGFSWLPLLMGASTRLAIQPREIGPLFAAWLAAGFMILSMPSYCLVFAFLTIGIAGGLGFVGWRRSGDMQTLRLLVHRFGLLGIGLLVWVGVALIPALISQGVMIRWTGTGAEIGLTELSWEAYIEGQLHPKDLLAIALPMNVKEIVGRLHIGIVPCLLAAALIVMPKRRVLWVTCFAVLGVIFLLAQTGEHLGFSYIFYYLPPFSLIRQPTRFAVLTTPLVCFLAGLGISYLLEKRRHFATCLVILVALSTAIVYGYEHVLQSHYLTWRFTELFLLIAVLLLIFFRRQPILMVACLGAVWLVGIKTYPLPFAVKEAQVIYQNEDSYAALRHVQRTIPDRSSYRLGGFSSGLDARKWAGNSAFFGFRSLLIFLSPIPYDRFRDIFYIQGQPHPKHFVMGLKYLITEDSNQQEVETWGFRTVERQLSQTNFSLFARDIVLPRFFFASRLEPGKEEHFFPEILEGMAKGAVISAPCFIANGEKKLENRQWDVAETRMEILSNDRQSFRVRVSTLDGGMLVINEYFDKGWKFKIDGKTHSPIRVNGFQHGLLLSGGTQEIVGQFAPTGLEGLRMLHYASWFLFPGVCLVLWLKRERLS